MVDNIYIFFFLKKQSHRSPSHSYQASTTVANRLYDNVLRFDLVMGKLTALAGNFMASGNHYGPLLLTSASTFHQIKCFQRSRFAAFGLAGHFNVRGLITAKLRGPWLLASHDGDLPIAVCAVALN